jgi:hypothetical protein
MEVEVWDTYVTKKDGSVMHFDILVPEKIKDNSKIFGYGNEYLKSKEQEGQPITSKECKLCHIETLRKEWEIEIRKNGYIIVEMENCQ